MDKGKQKAVKHKIIQMLLFHCNCDNAINKIYGQIIRMYLKRNLAFKKINRTLLYFLKIKKLIERNS